MARTAVFFHAHPDDEALLTAGTMAMLAAEGHRVVLIVATAGERGLAELPHGEALAEARTGELYASAAVLGVARVVLLGYGDSGLDTAGLDERGVDENAGVGDDRPPNAFIDADIEEAAQRVAAVLKEEDADLLTIYDPAGGYGHPDHVQVYRVGQRAADLAGTPILLEATVNRDPLLKALRLAQRFYRFPPEFDVRSFERAYSPGEVITHRVNVRRYTKVKRASMAAHASQASGGDGARTLGVMLKIPGALYRLVFGTEWYVRRELPPGSRRTHPFDDLPPEETGTGRVRPRG
ncbi:GlcNAc-PI de-N-acetylase [Sphaerisporangium siamense]|uniref:LmbE family N-acetylglucosaminyl deacetylase n=1 Tax=Sphaerisporangium siamense TaxID=795645 RepID=A0A7W7GAS4_9ACTN|nr:PIG-L family deacetylase [Sphaerisporangium siamense]MBB4701724.1 LmbE family N-acetylglucosaminyl deacetylase [Sphaerisporangium siamense]GII84372.1 GlcNAc-PI de-N-acetylase [Sphaerisporangium siamense]